MLINFSNHPTSKWTALQLQTARALYGDIKDIPFPAVLPTGDEAYIKALAQQCLAEILAIPNIQAVHIMGEMTLCFALIKLLKAHKIKCIASTTKRHITAEGVPVFEFEQFREYC